MEGKNRIKENAPKIPSMRKINYNIIKVNIGCWEKLRKRMKSQKLNVDRVKLEKTLPPLNP